MPTPTNLQMRTLWIKLRLIRTMQTNYLMSNKIPPRLDIPRHRLAPQARTPILPTKRLLEPIPRLDRPVQQPLLPDFKPRCGGGVEGAAVVGFIGAVCEPCDHGAHSVYPVCVHGGDVLPCCDGYVCAGRGARRVAGEGVVGDFEDGVVGYSFALDHPLCAVLHRLVAVRVVAIVVLVKRE
jgi:hypothetical protein